MAEGDDFGIGRKSQDFGFGSLEKAAASVSARTRFAGSDSSGPSARCVSSGVGGLKRGIV